MPSDFLKERLIKNTKKHKFLKWCYITIGLLGSLYCTLQLNKKVPPPKQSETSLFSLDKKHILQAFLFFSICLSSASSISLSFYYPRKKRTPKSVLNHLKFSSSNEETSNPYTPLSKRDIKKILSKVDLSHLSEEKQIFFLQNLIDVSNKHPSLAKLFKQELIPTTIKHKAALKSIGSISHPTDVIQKGLINLSPKSNFLTFIHELIHAKQILDGTFYFKRLLPFAAFINEAQAKAYTMLLKKEEEAVMHKIVTARRSILKNENHLLNDKELQGKAEEESVAVIINCLISEHNLTVTRDTLSKFCPNALTAEESLDIYKLCLLWRISYENKNLKNLSQKINRGLKISSKEICAFSHLDAYFQNKTTIPVCIRQTHITQSGHPLYKIITSSDTNQR